MRSFTLLPFRLEENFSSRSAAISTYSAIAPCCCSRSCCVVCRAACAILPSPVVTVSFCCETRAVAPSRRRAMIPSCDSELLFDWSMMVPFPSSALVTEHLLEHPCQCSEHDDSHLQ